MGCWNKIHVVWNQSIVAIHRSSSNQKSTMIWAAPGFATIAILASSFPVAQAFVIGHRYERREILVHHRTIVSPTPNSSFASPSSMLTVNKLNALPPQVWVEEAEEGFVDEEENLEPGEVCLRSVKSFASGETDRRFLSAGAVVKRPSYDSSAQQQQQVCDVWIADSLLKQGGPNLQLRGALLVLDDLFLDHLQREQQTFRETESESDKHDDSWAIRALQNFVVHCGDDDTIHPETWRSTSHVAASAMAASLRGFVPLKEMVRTNSIYSAGRYDGDTSGLVLDPSLERYATALQEDDSILAESIHHLLPSKETIARHTTKRFTFPRRTQEFE